MPSSAHDLGDVISVSEGQGERVVLAARLEEAAKLREHFLGFLNKLGVTPQEREEWMLVLSELWANAVEYGAGAEVSHRLCVEWRLRGERVVLAIEDPGGGPVQERQRAVACPEGLGEHVSRGLYLVDQICDEREHWISSKGHRVEVAKRHVFEARSPAEDELVERLLEELSASYESLAAFYEMSPYLVESTSLRDYVSKLLKTLEQGHDFDWLRLVIANTGSSLLKRQLLCLRLVEAEEASPLLEQVRDSAREFVWSEAVGLAAQDRERFPLQGCCLPVIINDEVAAFLLAGRKDKEGVFRSADLSKLRAFANLIGLSGNQASLRQMRDKSQQMLREYDIATDIQRNLLPIQRVVDIPGYEVCIRHNSAGQVSGDYVEVMKVGEDCWYAAVIDVMGKGVSAALLATLFRTAFVTLCRRACDLVEMMEELNEVLCYQLSGLMYFVTCTLVKVDLRMHSVELVNAGHCPALVWRKGVALESIEATGAPLGIFAQGRYARSVRKLEEGESLIIVTDGCYEWEEMKEPYGWERFERLVGRAFGGQPEAFWDSLQEMIETNTLLRKRADDETFFCLKRMKS